ncbi:LysR family transcriptional regulator, partial [Vibrio parahaemolyticus]
EHILYKSCDLVLDKWTFTHKQTQQQCRIKLESTLSFNLVQSILDATLAGCGVAMLDEFALAKLESAQKEQLVIL